MEIRGIREALDGTGAVVSNSVFMDVDLSNSSVSGVNLSATRFIGVNLPNASITDANLSSTLSSDVNLSHVRTESALLAGMTINGVLVTDLFAALAAADKRQG